MLRILPYLPPAPKRVLHGLSSSGMRLAGLLVLVAVFMVVSPTQRAEGATTVVDVGDIWFCSASFANGVCPTDIVVGDTVSWDFSGAFLQHFATECGASCNTPTGTPLFESGGVPPNPQKYEFTFTTAGQYLYYCNIHPTQMRGVINVSTAVGGVAELSSVSATPLAATTADGLGYPLLASLFGAGVVGVAGIAILAASWRQRRLR